MNGPDVVGIGANFLALVLLASAGGKLRMLQVGRLTDLIAIVPGPYRFRRHVLALVIIVEIGAVAALALEPRLGLVGASVLFAIYSLYVITIPDGTPCYCFGGAFEFGQRRAARIGRNSLLLFIACSSAVASFQYGAESRSILAATGAGAALILAYGLDAFLAAGRELFPDYGRRTA